MDGAHLDIDKYKNIWCGTIQAFENKDIDNDYKESIKDKKIINITNNKNDQDIEKIISFLKRLMLSNSNNIEKLINCKTSHNERTILHLLVIKRKGKEYKLNPNIYDKFNETPLHYITKYNEEHKHY